MSSTMGQSKTISLALAGGGVLFLLAAGGTLVPLRRRQDG
jgi:LPXTG-motif cell wall-anchored protein